MNAFYDSLRAMAARLLKERGVVAQLRVLDSSDGTLLAEHDLRVVKVNRERHSAPHAEVQIGDWMCIAEEKGVVLAQNNLIIINGKEYTIVRADEIEPADTRVCWFFWARLGI